MCNYPKYFPLILNFDTYKDFKLELETFKIHENALLFAETFKIMKMRLTVKNTLTFICMCIIDFLNHMFHPWCANELKNN